MGAFLGEGIIPVAAMAVIVGGSLALAIAGSRSLDQAFLGAEVRSYEWVFWIAASVIVLTGVGNMAALGQGLPNAEGGWGSLFRAKLLVVGLLLALSFGRTLLVTLGIPTRLLTRVYGATATLGTMAVIAAVGLAHG